MTVPSAAAVGTPAARPGREKSEQKDQTPIGCLTLCHFLIDVQAAGEVGLSTGPDSATRDFGLMSADVGHR